MDVQTLRSWQNNKTVNAGVCQIIGMAADEIESKEIELNAAAEAVLYWRAENERLARGLAAVQVECERQARLAIAGDMEIERLHAALQPFADAVYNDNGDMTITPANLDAYRKAYFVMRRANQQQTEKDK